MSNRDNSIRLIYQPQSNTEAGTVIKIYASDYIADGPMSLTIDLCRTIEVGGYLGHRGTWHKVVSVVHHRSSTVVDAIPYS